MFDKFLNAPILKGERITLSIFERGDIIPYFKLASNKKENEFWGYDYTQDIKNEPTPNDFFNLLENLKNNREELSFSIKKDNCFLGEVVVHDFTLIDFEIGFRILPEYKRKGYTFESVSLLLDYIKKEINPKKVRAKCYHENLYSKNLLLKLGFNLVKTDEIYYRFELK